MMIWIDYTLLALLVMTASLGLLRGFKIEIYAIFVWLLGILIGIIFCQESANFIDFFAEQLPLKLAFAFIGLLAITLLLGSTIGYLLGDVLTQTSFIGRLMGACIGTLRGLLIITTLVLLAGLSPLPSETWWHEAQVILPFQQVVLRFRDTFPTDLSRFIHYQ